MDSTKAQLTTQSTPLANNTQASTVPPVSLKVTVLRTRLLLITFVVVAIVVGTVVAINSGVALRHFDGVNGNDAATSKLVDDYNSYSANVATVFGRPVGQVVGVMVHVVMLRFAAVSVMRSGSSWRRTGFVMFAISAVEYLVLNGFNALNVQSQRVGFDLVISMSDLSISANTSNYNMTSGVTNFTTTFPESAPKNPIANTVLRNVTLPRVTKPDPMTRKCDASDSCAREDIVNYGFPSRAWQSAMLSTAVEPKLVRIPITEAANAKIDSLPMSATRAANLFYSAAAKATDFFPWFDDYFAAAQSHVPSLADGDSKTFSMTQVLGFLPDYETNDQARLDWFLQQSQAVMANNLSNTEGNNSKNVSERAVALEFAHIDISSTISFDAVAFEVEVILNDTGRFHGFPNGSLYDDFYPSERCSASPGFCLFGKPAYGKDELVYDVPSQINVVSACFDGNGADEGISVRLTDASGEIVPAIDCNKTSDTSLFVVSIGKRLVADALHDNTTNTTFPGVYEPAVVLNLRKIYTFTLGRLAWQPEDLSQAFQARCDINEGDRCNGLRYDLEDGRVLVVSTDKLPLDILSPLRSYQRAPDFVSLVQVVEPPISTENFGIEVVRADRPSDILMPHNIERFEWNSTHGQEGNQCMVWVENRLHSVLINHLYIESTLQPSYTAAMFFLFQDAVAKNFLNLEDGVQALNFDGNIEKMIMRLSIPQQNMVLTLVGCTLLLLGAFLVRGWK
ncbi:hypothetical protein Poli38472_003436 [Pythium oligandrum]|uniref:Uncharacterized protein n=1 Tax=Pythium oligandrum TaxID=41045 RepID=A0A8K1FCS1_PYTOL|nr:hypothetical protein Poli38472_003436 [Pythium oligandrum]|eukprot:TMW57511.1 hypothetical protein Poli38472_003436 [Pythium oligandrum]